MEFSDDLARNLEWINKCFNLIIPLLNFLIPINFSAYNLLDVLPKNLKRWQNVSINMLSSRRGAARARAVSRRSVRSAWC